MHSIWVQLITRLPWIVPPLHIQYSTFIIIRFKLPLSWNGQTVEAEIYWFQNESDPTLNSNAYDVARTMVEKQFPGDFGIERLVQSAVNIIIKCTTKATTTPAVASCLPDDTEDRSTPRAKGYSDEDVSKDASHGES